jgi:hypothetical protein
MGRARRQPHAVTTRAAGITPTIPSAGKERSTFLEHDYIAAEAMQHSFKTVTKGILWGIALATVIWIRQERTRSMQKTNGLGGTDRPKKERRHTRISKGTVVMHVLALTTTRGQAQTPGEADAAESMHHSIIGVTKGILGGILLATMAWMRKQRTWPLKKTKRLGRTSRSKKQVSTPE